MKWLKDTVKHFWNLFADNGPAAEALADPRHLQTSQHHIIKEYASRPLAGLLQGHHPSQAWNKMAVSRHPAALRHDGVAIAQKGRHYARVYVN